MAYQSLYRKYRSKDFTDLVGQTHVTQTLMNAIGSGRVSHAYLFCGPRGTGKTSTARVLAKALNCVNGPTSTPCDTCIHCTAIRKGSAMDVIEIDAASNRNIDDIRNLREQVNYPPVELNYKFYIVDEVHQLTRDSFNAFLKTLEEPPGHVIFVLCTTDPHQLPATILSRCQRFDFRRITFDDIINRLRYVVEAEGWTAEDEALLLLARTANGGMRDALSLLDQAASYAGTHITAQHVRDILGGIDLTLLLEFSELVLTKQADGIFKLIDRIMAEGKDVPQLVGELILHWRNLLRVHIGGADALEELNPDQRQAMVTQARLASQPAIMRAVTLWCEAENELRWNSQQRLLLELYALRVMSEDPIAAVPAPQPRPQAAPAQPQPARPSAPPRETPPPAPEAPAADGPWTIDRVKQTWPGFIDWMRRSSNLDNLRTRVVEKCWPTALKGDTLVLATASPLTRSAVEEREPVKTALAQCLQSYFKHTLLVTMEVQDDVAPTSPAPSPATTAPPPPADEPARDIVGERMAKFFTGSEEITG